MHTRFLIVILFATLFTTRGVAQDESMYYVYFADGRVYGYPKELIKDVKSDAGGYTFTLENDSVITWTAAEVESVSDMAPAYPQFTAFRLDDKLNDQLYRDVEATITSDVVTATVSGIGKYLTPLFAMDMSGAEAYVDGTEQVSGVSRHRFADEVVYTLSHPDYRRLSMEKVSDEVWSDPEGNVTEIALTADMLSTNAPSGRGEGLENLVDDLPTTFFHSTWSNDPLYEKLPEDEYPYISVALTKPVSALKFYYQARIDSNERNPYAFKVYASHDQAVWYEIAYFDETAGIPTTGKGVEFTSPTIEAGEAYSYWKFEQTACAYKNYLVLSTFRLYEVTGTASEPELLQPAKYDHRMIPMGREVPVRIDWLTDHATSVPRIDIDIDGGEMVTSKEYYLNAHITFTGNGVWDDYDFQDSVKIKGRGNSSWSTPSDYYSPKNPYRLKFAESVKPFGMKKGKNWNLIAQKLSGSLMTNPVAHKIARLVGVETANDVVPVELYMNGEYRGSYFFTQKVGMANNNVDYEDESMAALFELDEYYEAGQFTSDSYGLPVNIKAPEFGEDETLLDYYGVQEEFNRFETAVYNNSNYERFVDMDMLVRYMLTNDLVLNSELNHPKSTFLSREHMGHMSRRYVFGPAWDFDWAYGYEGSGSYCVSSEAVDLFSFFSYQSGSQFFSDVLRSSDWVQYRYSKLWTEFVNKHLQEVIDFVDDYYAYARSSFVHNAEMWGDGYDYSSNVANMKSWLAGRAQYIMGSLTPYDADAPEPFAYGDLNGDGAVDATDMTYMLSALFGSAEGDWLSSQADADADGVVSLADLTWLALLVTDGQNAEARSPQRRAMLWSADDEEEECVYDFDIDDMPTLTPSQGDAAQSTPLRTASTPAALSLTVDKSSEGWTVDVALTNPTPYIAYSMDFKLPEGFTLPDGDAGITLSSRTAYASFVTTGRWVADGVYRVIGYSSDNTAMLGTEGALFTLVLSGTSSLASGVFELSATNGYAVTENAFEEEMASGWATFEVTESQVTHSFSPMTQQPCWPADVYDIHGRLVRKQALSLDGLGKGIYIINHCKYGL